MLPNIVLGQDQWVRSEFGNGIMGTEFRLVIYSKDTAHARAAADSVFVKLNELNQIFSDYDLTSEVSRLSEHAGTGIFVPVSPDLWNVLQLGRELARLSDGVFDPTIGPLSKLWRRAIRRREVPDSSYIEKAGSLVNWNWMEMKIETRGIRLSKAGMSLDLGGLAKGYSVDCAFHILQKMGMESVLIDGGGDIYAGAPPPGKPGWDVAFYGQASNQKHDAAPKYISYRAVAGSGNTYRSFVDQGSKYGHLIDAETWEAGDSNEIVYVFAPNCALADGLATSLSLMPSGQRSNLTNKFEATDFIVLADGVK